jgi:hypothetical protein
MGLTFVRAGQVLGRDKAELSHIPQGLRCDAFQLGKTAPFGIVHFRKIGLEFAALLDPDDIADIMMPVLRLIPFGAGRNAMGVDVDGQAGCLMPGIEDETLRPRLLKRLKAEPGRSSGSS